MQGNRNFIKFQQALATSAYILKDNGKRIRFCHVLKQLPSVTTPVLLASASAMDGKVAAQQPIDKLNGAGNGRAIPAALLRWSGCHSQWVDQSTYGHNP